jgi:hypothetical protein
MTFCGEYSIFAAGKLIKWRQDVEPLPRTSGVHCMSFHILQSRLEAVQAKGSPGSRQSRLEAVQTTGSLDYRQSRLQAVQARVSPGYRQSRLQAVQAPGSPS